MFISKPVHLLIHATNIQGLGAAHVVRSFLEAASRLGLLDNSVILLPSKGLLADFQPERGIVKRYARTFPNSFSRLLELLFARLQFPVSEKVIVLGDIPLFGIKNQIVLVHQSNLLSRDIHSVSENSFVFKIMRIVFRINCRFVKNFIVQSSVFASGLEKTFPRAKGKVIVVPQPPPDYLKRPGLNSTLPKSSDNKIILFYPSAGYPYKNHFFLHTINTHIVEIQQYHLSFEIWVTLTDSEFRPYKDLSFVRNLGRLSANEMNNCYGMADALLFLSLTESFGLPLIEAMHLELPILCVDLPYSRWVCENSAYYFQHKAISSFIDQLRMLNKDLLDHIKPDYKSALEKFPTSWEQVVSEFEKVL